MWSNMRDINETATLNEYEAALRLGDTCLAKRIRAANNDLEEDFQTVASLFKD
jgi:hypothetical protein